MYKINLTHTEKEEKRMKLFFPFFESFNRDFGKLGIEIAVIRFKFGLVFLEIGCMQILVNLAELTPPKIIN